MRVFTLVFIGVGIFLLAPHAFAVPIQNDSSSIDFINDDGGGGGSHGDEGGSGEGGSGSGSGSQGGDDLFGGGGSGEGGGEGGGSSETPITIVITDSNGNPVVVGNPSGNPDPNGLFGGSGGTSSGDTKDIILQTLLGDSAISGGVGGGSDFLISGDRARKSLRAKNISSLSISWDNSQQSATKTVPKLVLSDVKLIAASLALNDENIDEISFGLDAFDVTYKGNGRLFFIVPISFPIYVHVDPTKTAPGERVTARYPWYRFFVWTQISRRQLELSIDKAVIREVELGTDGYERQATLVQVVSGILASYQ